MTDQIDEIDSLHLQLERVQVREAEALRNAQQTEGQLLDRNAYNQKRQAITETHAEASKILIQTIEETKEATRKNLAMSLKYEGNTETERQQWAEAIRLCEGATSIDQQEALIHRALRWGDKALARALTMRFCGAPDRRPMHEVLAGVDDRVRATFDFESRHGAYKKQNRATGDLAWPGWRTYKQGDIVDIPGRPDHLQPSFLREQKRQRLAKLKAGQ